MRKEKGGRKEGRLDGEEGRIKNNNSKQSKAANNKTFKRLEGEESNL